MNILDDRFGQFQSLSTEEKTEYFKKDGHLYDMIISQQLNRDIIEDIYAITNQLRQISKTKAGSLFAQGLLCHKRAMLWFTQPSSRTFLSFESACHMLGMKTSEIRDVNVSSEVKGESYDDSLRTFSSYTDLIIIRHRGENIAERAAWLLNTQTNRPVPIINGGSGSDQHPTQAILDVYTLQRSFEKQGGLEGKTILMCGDLRRGRTVRSLSYLLKNFEGVEIIYTAPGAFQMKEDVLTFLDRHRLKYSVETEALANVLSRADAIYMTRIQDEHDEAKGDSDQIDISRFKLSPSHMAQVKPTAVIMHPFPRRDEIDVSIDSDPRAMYWRQERNGMWTRAALIAYIFQVHEEILDYRSKSRSRSDQPARDQAGRPRTLQNRGQDNYPGGRERFCSETGEGLKQGGLIKAEDLLCVRSVPMVRENDRGELHIFGPERRVGSGFRAGRNGRDRE